MKKFLIRVCSFQFFCDIYIYIYIYVYIACYSFLHFEFLACIFQMFSVFKLCFFFFAYTKYRHHNPVDADADAAKSTGTAILWRVWTSFDFHSGHSSRHPSVAIPRLCAATPSPPGSQSDSESVASPTVPGRRGGSPGEEW